MKIKNDFVNIKIGNKIFEHHNLILDTYLERFAGNQLNLNEVRSVLWNKEIKNLCVKLDEPLENIQPNSVFYNEDFNFCILSGGSYTREQNVSENQIKIKYQYQSNIIMDYDDNNNHGIEEYYGRKITALGFTTTFAKGFSGGRKTKVCAILDTSNYNIYLEENQEFVVTRQDTITTDALFYSNNPKRIPGPAHLAPQWLPESWQWWDNDQGGSSGIGRSLYSQLYSMGFSNYIDRIDKEFVIGEDIEALVNGSTISIEGLENELSNYAYGPFSSLAPLSNLPPLKQNYKYLIFKYKLYHMHYESYEDDGEMVETGEFYHQAIPLEKFGNLNIKIKYERG